MKTMKKIFAICLCLVMALSCVPSAFAASVADATIDESKTGSLTIYKYDWTNANKDGVWNEDSFISTGWRESYVEQVLGGAVPTGDANGKIDSVLGNGQISNGYAIKGVEFTILRIADIVTFTESANDGHDNYNLNQVLYGIDKTAGADFLAAIGLAGGAQRYENADKTGKLDSSKYYYQSDVLIKALSAALLDNATTVKNALESYVAASKDAIVMDLTNENGMTTKSGLELGLYLAVETKVPEMVTSTTNPFLVSVPMTTVSGNEHSASPEGGHEWNYDIVVYPKNDTGIVSLEKAVREAKEDTGKNNASNVITDGFAHNGTGSAGDVMEYQIISTLPMITSNATALSTYNFFDTLSEGLSYNKDLQDVKIEFFTDKECTNKVASWNMGSGKFTVSYSSDDRTMTVDITKAGLDEINGSAENVNGKLYTSYSNYTLRLTYTATINSDTTALLGQDGNCNEVVLTWKRSSGEYYDTLIDDCHVYTFGIDLTKLFYALDSKVAEDNGMFQHVKFKIYNNTDKYWVTATLNAVEGIYYVDGHVTEEADATIFTPVTSGADYGKIHIQGCEDDEYILTEIETANGYTLLKNNIHVSIVTADDATRPCDIYSKDTLGLLQNDPRYAFNGGKDLTLANIPQVQLAHNMLTASATVDGNPVVMLADEDSGNAEVALTVINTRGFDLPDTGDAGVWMYAASGLGMMFSGGAMLFLLGKRKNKEEETAQQ